MLLKQILSRLLALLVLLGLVLLAYWLWARPYQLHWGATQAEIARAMPGDELDPNPTFLATRAITIQGSPQEIWPWLVQMGYNRAGYYGYDIIENLGSSTGLASAENIVPDYQHFVVGDPVPISPEAQEVFYAIQPEQYLIWAGTSDTNPGGFTWALYPLDATHTRLVSRIRWSQHSISQPAAFSLDMFTEFTDHLAVRKILQGVKGRVEGHNQPLFLSSAEFFVYLAALIIFLAALIMILIRPLSWSRWLAGLAAGAGWLVCWYAPLPTWLGALLEILVVIGLYLAFFQTPEPALKQQT
ncbi:MAG TPA: hypothetical protein VKF38_12920 [Anaerolineaceae bacterium]|nr:hypothetical protein [Anaerolineaceae bacterium]